MPGKEAGEAVSYQRSAYENPPTRVCEPLSPPAGEADG